MAGYGTSMVKMGSNPNKPVKNRKPEQEEAIKRRMKKMAPPQNKEQEDRARKSKQVGY